MEPMVIVILAFFFLSMLQAWWRNRQASRPKLGQVAAEAARLAEPAPQPEPQPVAARQAVEEEVDWQRLARIPALLRASPEKWAKVQEGNLRSYDRKSLIEACIADVEEAVLRGEMSRAAADRIILRLRLLASL